MEELKKLLRRGGGTRMKIISALALISSGPANQAIAIILNLIKNKLF